MDASYIATPNFRLKEDCLLCIDVEKQLRHFVTDTDVEAKVASLAVSCAMGEIQFTGGGLQSGGSISGEIGRASCRERV